MTRDFTLRSYERLLSSLLENGYRFLTFEEYLEKGLEGKQVILRHDVDDLPENSHRTAIIEHQLGIKGVYYFRIVRQSNHPNVIRDIAALGMRSVITMKIWPWPVAICERPLKSLKIT